MKGIWLEKGETEYREDIEPKPIAGEAEIKVRTAGICATDLELVKGYYPFSGVLGHEFVGEVCSSPSQPELEGNRVVGEINVACGSCAYCLAGMQNHCPNRTVLGIAGRNGAFAERIWLPAENLHPVPASLPDEAALFSEPLAAALQIPQQEHVRPQDRVLLIGAGKLGQIIARVFAQLPVRVTGVARYEKQRLLLEAAGVEALPEGGEIKREYDLVVEATGSAGGLEMALDFVKPRGRIILKSTYKGRGGVDFSRVVVDEVRLIGSRCGPFAPALRLLAEERIDPRPLISDCFPLSRGVEAFDRARQGGVLKVLLEIGE